MPDTKISDFTAASTLTGTELVAGVQTADNVKITVEQLRTFSNTSAGSTTQVIFNDAGTLAGDSGLTFNKTTDTLSVGGDVNMINSVISNNPGAGIKLDTIAPVFGWRDILGDITVRGTGGADPSFAIYTGTIMRQFQFSATVEQEVFIIFHIPHDYVPGSNIHLHIHWSNAAAIPNTGNVVWGFDYSFAKGFNQESFPAFQTITVTQQCPATRYQHNVAETAAISIPSLEVDGVLLVRVYRAAANVADTCTDAVFAHTADVHYQSTNTCTKNKAPNFYT